MASAEKGLIIRQPSREEFSLLIDWAAEEGWNPGLHDGIAFWAADPAGYLIGLLDGLPVAAISAVRYGQHFGFIGFYIVKPEFRGNGYGLAIWQAAIQHLQGRTIGLDGVVDQQANYRRSGFALSHRNIRYEAIAKPPGSAPPTSPCLVVPLNQISQASLQEYDQDFFPEPRSAFLNAWVSQPGTLTLVAVDASRPCGYSVLRPCRTGFKIGPLFADTPAIAEQLFAALSQQIPPGVPFFLDVPASNQAAMELAMRHDMKKIFETARMYQGTAPELSIERTYGITSFELG